MIFTSELKIRGLRIYALFLSAVIMVVALIGAKKNVPLVGAAFDEDASAIRARELIKQSRLAAGLEGDGNGIQTLKFTAKSQRFIKYVSVQSPTKVEEKEKTLSGKIQAEFSLPDKFRVKTRSDTLNGFDVSYTEIINGDEAWRNPPMQVRSLICTTPLNPSRPMAPVGQPIMQTGSTQCMQAWAIISGP